MYELSWALLVCMTMYISILVEQPNSDYRETLFLFCIIELNLALGIWASCL